jgi:O-Antigen ligase
MMKDGAWAYSVALFTGLLFLVGGSSLPTHALFLVITLASLAILVFGLWRLRERALNRIEFYALGIIALGTGLVLAQLVPLPPQVWTQLGGRGFVAEGLEAAGAANQWLPLSLSADMTRQDVLALLPGLAAFVAALSLPREKWLILALVLVGVATLSVLVGLAQKFQGASDGLNFYGHQGGPLSSGFFANPNFYSAFLSCSIPFIAAIALGQIKQNALPALLIGFIAVVTIALMIAGLGATASRAGVLLAMVAVFFSLFLMSGRSEQRRIGAVSSYGSLFICLAIGLFALFSMTGLLRLAGTDPVSDYRAVISSVSMVTLKGFLPFGSGFGSFVPAYQLFETPATMLSSYVNHAHNDWLELVLEGGLPMAFILAAFVMWFGAAVISVWRNAESELIAKAACISVSILLLHSFVDYPLRTPALMVMFALCCGFMAQTTRPLLRKRVPDPMSLAPTQNVIAFRPHAQGFARTARPSL